MAGKFINELSSNPPAPEDLVVFFDKSKAVTVQAPLSDVAADKFRPAPTTSDKGAWTVTALDLSKNTTRSSGAGGLLESSLMNLPAMVFP